MTYLEDHPPARSQYRKPRRAKLTGAIVLHDAENATDLDGPDTGAEAVARFISTRSDPGSYHTIVDSDSIVRLVPYDWEAYHEGTGGNPWSLGLSLAYGSKRTPTATWWAGALRNAATEARAMAAHVHATTGITVPARRITAAQYRAGAAGFISHAELDPARRSDPVGFPWDVFLSLYANTTSTPEAPTMPTTSPASDAMVEQWQRMLLDNGARLGDAGPNQDGADGLFGRLTLEASKVILDHRNQLLKSFDEALVLARKAETAVANLLARAEAAEARAAELEQRLTAALAGSKVDVDAALRIVHDLERQLGGDGA